MEGQRLSMRTSAHLRLLSVMTVVTECVLLYHQTPSTRFASHSAEAVSASKLPSMSDGRWR